MRRFFLLFFLLASPAWAATTYFVDANPGGDCAGNYNPATRACDAGGTYTSKDTIGEGLALMSAGDTLYIRAGTYDEDLFSWTDTLPRGTDYTTGVINVSRYQSESVTMSGSFLIRGSDYNDSTVPKYWIVTGIVFDNDGAGNSVFGTYPNDTDPNGRIAQYFKFYSCEFNNSGMDGINLNPQTCTTSGATDAHMDFIDCIFDGNGTDEYHHGAYVEASYVTFSGCIARNNTGNGFKLDHPTDGRTLPNNCAVYDSQAYDNSTAADAWTFGILVGGTDNAAYRNVVYGNSQGISIGSNSTNAKVYSNVVYDNDYYNICVFGQFGGVYDAVVYGNTVADGDIYGIFIEVGNSGGYVSVTVKNNISYNNATSNYTEDDDGYPAKLVVTKSNNSTDGTNPQFVGGGNYHLTSSTPSSIINAGAVLGAPYNVDKDSVTRCSPPDIGAYEYGGCPGASIVNVIADAKPIPCDPVSAIRKWVSEGILKGSWSVSSATGLININLSGKKLAVQ